MLHKIRRVVAGLNEEGRSALVFDGNAGTVAENPHWEGFGVTLLWRTEQTPVQVRQGIDEADVPLAILPPPGGSSCVMCQFPPLSSLDSMTAEERELAQGLTFGDAGDDQDLRLHATPTIDYLVMIQGELTLMLEAGETTLKAGDTLVDCGVKHGWENRGSEPALCMVTMIDKAD